MDNKVTVGEIDFEITEPNFQEVKTASGCVIPKDPQITNTGSVESFYRLRIMTPVFHGAVPDENAEKKWKTVRSPLFTWKTEEGWRERTEMKTEVTVNGIAYECRFFDWEESVLPGRGTAPLFTSVRMITFIEGELPAGTRTDIRVTAYAVQSGGMDSVEAAFDRYAMQNQTNFLEA